MRSDPRVAIADRVYYGWVIVLACFLASVVVFGTSYAFGVFYDALLEAFDAPRSLLALVFGLQTTVIYTAGIGAGRLIERRGQRWVTAASAVVLVSGLVWTAFARTYLELLVSFGVVAAVGMSGLYIVGYATLPAWFERRRGAATGIASAGLGVGLLVIPPGADRVISAFGWRVAMLVVAGVVALLTLVIVLALVDRPEDVGATRDVEFPDADGRSTDRGEMPAGRLREIVTSGPFLLVLVGWLLIFTPLYVVLSHVVLHAADIGLGRSTGVLAVALVGLTTTVARVGIGLLSDSFGRTTAFVACGALLGAATVSIGVVSTTWLFLASIALFGAGYGGCGGLLGAITADLFGNRSLNTLFAVLSLSFAASGLLAPTLAGVWFETVGSYRIAFVVAGALGVAGAASVGLAVRSS